MADERSPRGLMARDTHFHTFAVMTDVQAISLTKHRETRTVIASSIRHRLVQVFICTLLVGASACGSQREETATGGDNQAPPASETTTAPGSPPEAPANADTSRPQPPPAPPAEGNPPAPVAPAASPPGAPSPQAASGSMLLRPPAAGSYVYVRERGSQTDERTEEYREEQKGDDYVVMFRQFRLADVTMLSVEAWANSKARAPGVYWIQTRVPGVTSDWCKWPADKRPRLLPGDLSKPQTLGVDSTCTIGPGETMTVKGVVEVMGRSGSTDRARVDTKVTVSYQGPARSATRQVEGTALISPSEGLVTEASGSYSGTGLSRTEFRDRLKK